MTSRRKALKKGEASTLQRKKRGGEGRTRRQELGPRHRENV